jgi:methyl-accepting chemotaxis protein
MKIKMKTLTIVLGNSNNDTGYSVLSGKSEVVESSFGFMGIVGFKIIFKLLQYLNWYIKYDIRDLTLHVEDRTVKSGTTHDSYDPDDSKVLTSCSFNTDVNKIKEIVDRIRNIVRNTKDIVDSIEKITQNIKDTSKNMNDIMNKFDENDIKNQIQDDRMTNNENKNQEQDSRLDDIENTIDNQEERIKELEN